MSEGAMIVILLGLLGVGFLLLVTRRRTASLYQAPGVAGITSGSGRIRAYSDMPMSG